MDNSHNYSIFFEFAICDLPAGIAVSNTLMLCTCSDTGIGTCVSMDFVSLALPEQKSKLLQDQNMLKCHGVTIPWLTHHSSTVHQSQTSDWSAEHTYKDGMQVPMAPAQWACLMQAAP